MTHSRRFSSWHQTFRHPSLIRFTCLQWLQRVPAQVRSQWPFPGSRPKIEKYIHIQKLIFAGLLVCSIIICAHRLHFFLSFCKRKVISKTKISVILFSKIDVVVQVRAWCTVSPIILLTLQRKYVSPSVRQLCEVYHRTRYNRFRKLLVALVNDI